MDQNCPQGHAQEASVSASDIGGSPSPLKQPSICRKSLECAAVDPSPNVASVAPGGYDDAEIQKTDSGKIIFGQTEKSDLDILSIATLKIENISKGGTSYDNKTLVSTKSFEKKIVDPSQEKKLSTTADSSSKTEDNAASWYVRETEKLSLEDAAAEALELEYMKKYAQEYSKELLFAIDVMTLVRHLNNLEFQWIIYCTSGNPPTSACDDNLDQALKKLWEFLRDHPGHLFSSKMKTKGINYRRFQNMILHMAEKQERQEYDCQYFLMYCLVIAQMAVCAEGKEVTKARDFIPLAICRTIQTLKDSEKLPSDFWEGIAKKALDIVNGVDLLK